MGKFLVAIGCSVLVMSSNMVGDPIDKFAKALKQLSDPNWRPSQELVTDGDEPRAGRAASEAAIDPFYKKLTLDERLDDLDRRWKKAKELSPSEKVVLEQQTRDTLLLTISTILKDGLGTLRGIFESIAPDFSLAKAPIEDLADLIFLLGRLMEQISDKAYKENLVKLNWISKCLSLNPKARTVAKDKSGELICQKYECVSSGKCVAVFADYTIKFLTPYVEAIAIGVDVNGQHFKGALHSIVEIAVKADKGVKKVEESEAVKKVERLGKIFKLSLRMAKQLRNASIKTAKAA